MNTPDYLLHLGDGAVALVEVAFLPVIQSAAKRIARLGAITDSTAYELEKVLEAGYLAQDVLAVVSDLTGAGEDAPLYREIETALTEAAEQSIAFDSRVYKAAGKTVVPLSQSPALLRILRSEINRVGKELTVLTRTTAVTTQASFLRATDIAHTQIISGAMSYTQAIAQAVRTVASDGTYVLYPSGHRDTIEVAVRRAALTGTSQATGEMQLQLARDMGQDLMELTAHFGARTGSGFDDYTNHAWWQGLLVSLSGRANHLSLKDIGYGHVRGFKGANCRHDWFPFFPGLSVLAFTREELQAMRDATVPYNGEGIPYYKATQMQRQMERDIRKTKRELLGLDALGDGARYEYTEAAFTLRRQRDRLKDFEAQTGFLSQSDRQQIVGFGRSEASRATWGARKASATALPKVATAANTKLQDTLASDLFVGILPAGADIQSVRVIAGQGTSTPFRGAQASAAKDGGQPSQWQKKGGIIEGKYKRYDVHWEEMGGEQYRAKVKGVKSK